MTSPHANTPPRRTILLLQLTILVGGLAFWEAVVWSGAVDPFWASSPTQIATAFTASLASGQILFHTWVTLQEAFAGLAAGTLVGVALGLLLGLSRYLGPALEPFIIALNSLPRVALAPMIILFVGIGFASKFLLAFSLVVVPLMINTYEGVRSVDPDLVRVMRVFRASRTQVFLKLILPNCIPWLISGIRVSISLAIIGAIVGELISARAGIGYMIDRAAGDFDITGMLMPLIVLMLVAFTFDRLLLRLSNSLLRWREAQH